MTDTTSDDLSEAEVLALFTRLSNWGRWGADDSLGTLNHISAAHRARAAGLIRSGTVVSCAWPVEPGHAPGDEPDGVAPQRFMLRTGQGLADSGRVPRPGLDPGERYGGAAEYLAYAPHGYRITHVDGLSHIFWDRRIYNDLPAERVCAHLGATAHDMTTMRSGVVTRGILVDAARHRNVPWLDPGQGVTGAELEDILASDGLEISPGDALLLRTGYGRRRHEHSAIPAEAGHPGWHASCLPVVHEREVALLGSDTASDVAPSGYPGVRIPVHSVGLVAMGLPLLDNADLEDLAEQCAAHDRWEFFFTMAPLPFSGATGSAVNPLAVF